MKPFLVPLGIAAIPVVVLVALLLLQAIAMKDFCSDIRAGDKVEALRQRVAATFTFRATKDFTSNGEQAFFVRSDVLMSRANCLVIYSGDKVVLAKYVSD